MSKTKGKTSAKPAERLHAVLVKLNDADFAALKKRAKENERVATAEARKIIHDVVNPTND